MAFSPAIKRCAAERNALVDGAAISHYRCLADNHAHAVIDEDATADRRARMDFNAGEPATHLGGEAAEPAEATKPEPVRQLVDVDGVQPGIAGQDFPP